ncbi:MAG: beta-N-acetylhexosaminidase [Cyclobacteriaceae bacterium]|nr:beta-N-acetylhexosaminidase [Cyclobacteriaceae bacterium]
MAAFQHVIPKPTQAETDGGVFELNAQTTILTTPDAGPVPTYLAEVLRKSTGYAWEIQEGSSSPEGDNAIILLLEEHPDWGDEGYALTVDEDRVRISANHPAGLFYGVQTLLQILPPRVHESRVTDGPWLIATGQIIDQPRYAWRGMMLDVARHFFTVEEVKRTIDLAAKYKLNRFHLHLTDDQGWRIEIKSWPNLTAIGGSTEVGGGKGGFYTQEQYTKLVTYAAIRFVTVVPEIDLPGHINSALASYGELNGGIHVPEEGRVPGPEVNSTLGGKDRPTALYTGIQVGWSTLRLEKPATMKFVSDVLREVMSLTPGPYMHIGGDEAHVTKKEDYIQFIERFREIVHAGGKQMIGWEEIGQAAIDDRSIVQHWSQAKYAVTAAGRGARVIMSPATRTYLDMKYDSTTRLGLKWAAYIEVDDAYTWDPDTLQNLDPSSILGVEAPLWGETIDTMEDIEYLLFPRLVSLAEVSWTAQPSRNWEDFRIRLGYHGQQLEAMGIRYYPSPLVDWKQLSRN